MKRVARSACVIGLILAAAFAWARFFADPPFEPIPGGSLSGTLAPPPSDWSIAEGIQHLPIEHLGSSVPFSVRRWFMLYEGRIHLILPSLFSNALHERLLVDPRVRVRIGDTLYDQVATRVDIVAAYSAALPVLSRRQFAIEVSGTVQPLSGSPPVETWIWRLDDPAQ